MEIEVNISLDKLINKLANKLTLNVKKSNLLVFDSRKKSKEKSLSYLLMMRNLNKKTTKYLGVYFDKQLLWSEHI